jgi:hypothetical protein
MSEWTGPNAEISGPDLIDSGSDSDDGQASADVGGSGGGYNDRDDDNEAWALWNENDCDFCNILCLIWLLTTSTRIFCTIS